jgi:hypothetical protein
LQFPAFLWLQGKYLTFFLFLWVWQFIDSHESYWLCYLNQFKRVFFVLVNFGIFFDLKNMMSSHAKGYCEKTVTNLPDFEYFL